MNTLDVPSVRSYEKRPVSGLKVSQTPNRKLYQPLRVADLNRKPGQKLRLP
jgi:hypothetical protein